MLDASAAMLHQARPGLVASEAYVCGEFNRFRDLLGGDQWENDWEADDYLPNEFGGEDSVVAV